MMLAQPLIRSPMAFDLHRHRSVSSPRQYTPSDRAYPEQSNIQQPFPRNNDMSTGGLSFAEHELLRQRKTPYGKELESLDIANIDNTASLPASKHILLSLSPEANESPATVSRKRFAYNNHAPCQNVSHRQNAGQSFISEPPFCRGAWDSPGLYGSSAMHDNSAHAVHPLYHPAQSQIPTVMPAALQPSFGPTMSAGQQYYGPYWPDGTFSPYRPAPVRGDHFFHWRHSRDLSLDNDRNHEHGMHAPFQAPHYQKSALNDYMPVLVQGTEEINTQPPRDAFISYPSFHDRVANIMDDTMFSIPTYDQAATPHLHNPIGSQVQPFYHSTTSESMIRREQTFSWAYSIYVELLSQIQKGSKTNLAASLSRDTSQYSAMQLSHAKASTHPTSNCQPHVGKAMRQSTRTLSEGTSKTGHTWSANTTYLPHRGRGSRFGGSDTVAGSHPSKFSSPASTLPGMVIQPQVPYQVPPAVPIVYEASAIAAQALRALKKECQISQSHWTDGMLLAGCLAHGLGDYDGALAWYQGVLDQEPQHTEAMSNYAATLMALGRKDEAATQWSAAIKLQPSFFEAVEHLVGLYVGIRKTRDAVDIIEYVESCLRIPETIPAHGDVLSEDDSDVQSRTSSATVGSVDAPVYEYANERRYSRSSVITDSFPGFGAAGYAIPAADHGRLLALIHAKGNMLYSLGSNTGAAAAFEDAILIATGFRKRGMQALIDRILTACISAVDPYIAASLAESKEPVLLSPERAEQIASRLFPPNGTLPGLDLVPTRIAYRAAVSTTSNSLLSLAKIYQDGLSNQTIKKTAPAPGTRQILALYYLSLSLQPSPSTANNVGILLASVQNASTVQVLPQRVQNQVFNYTGVAPGSGVALALSYYNYGLNLDGKHAHLYTNLGSLLKDLGELPAAIKMYEIAVSCDATFDIALANLANAVKDQGKIGEAIKYYKRAVQSNPDFAEAVCGLATALNSVCDWKGRGGIYADNGFRDRYHVDDKGMLQTATRNSGWMRKVIEIVDKQLLDGQNWGMKLLTPDMIELLCRQLAAIKSDLPRDKQTQYMHTIRQGLQAWAGRKWEGSRVVRLLERAVKRIGWQWYQDRHVLGKEYPARRYARPMLPINLPVISAPTVLPFHTFTTPLSARQVRQISQRNALRISTSTMRAPWLSKTVYPPPSPPSPCLRVGYVSSDFNNHPLAHLMQSVFGLHNPASVRAYCYATTTSDGSIHRAQIEREAPVFRNAASWTVDQLVNQIVQDGIHILINLNGYTRGARNEIFAARPAPIHMSFMGFAGTLGAEWCDYVYADEISVSTRTLAPNRNLCGVESLLDGSAHLDDLEGWMYAENVIFAKSTFFCVDHKQSAPDASNGPPPLHDPILLEQAWQREQVRRWQLRKELFPEIADDTVILGNFNQLYKIDPSTFRMYLRILSRVPNSILWLLRFPEVGEQNLLSFAHTWAGESVAKRVIFTDVAPKGAHITRASVVDLFLDTPECNAHTTAADVVWSGSPIITWARWEYKMCSRMASSIIASALPLGRVGDEARRELLVQSDQQYEEHAIMLASTLHYMAVGSMKALNPGQGTGRLMELRRILWQGRWTSRLFDTKRWVNDLEKAYWKAWDRWVNGQGGDIFM